MKNLITSVLLLIVFCNPSFAQISTKRYFMEKSISSQQEVYDDVKGKISTELKLVVLERVDGKEIGVDMQIFLSHTKARPCFVAFENESSNKLIVNYLLSNNLEGLDSNALYSLQLKNNQSVKINFKQWTVHALTVPLKVNFGVDDEKMFSTGANFGALVGHTWGKTKFTHRALIGNKQTDTKSTLGLFMGADQINFSFVDSAATTVNVETVSLSTGLGYVFSYQNFSVGAVGGMEFALGEHNAEWSFDGKPWIGFTFGYSFLSF